MRRVWFRLDVEDKTPSGELNFAGAAKRYFDAINGDFKDETKDAYITNYNVNIIPYTDPTLPVREYDDMIILDLLTRVRKGFDYDDSTVRSRLRHLVFDPVSEYFKEFGGGTVGGWGSVLRLPADEKEDARLQVIRKSLTSAEEERMRKLLLSDPRSEDGRRIGLALMAYTGIRNNEACALDFGDIGEMKRHPGEHFIRVYKSTEINRSTRKLGGKTRNSPRILPILEPLYDFLMKRREYIQETVEFPLTGRNGKIYENVDKLPVACKGNLFTEACRSGDLSIAGRDFFEKEMKLEQDMILSAVQELVESDDELMEADATTYLLRRNFATHLYRLGFDEVERRYYMGHDLEETKVARWNFTDEFYLNRMWDKLKGHPVNRKE